MSHFKILRAASPTKKSMLLVCGATIITYFFKSGEMLPLIFQPKSLKKKEEYFLTSLNFFTFLILSGLPATRHPWLNPIMPYLQEQQPKDILETGKWPWEKQSGEIIKKILKLPG